MKKRVAIFDWDKTVQNNYAIRIWFKVLLENKILSDKFTSENDDLLERFKADVIDDNELADEGMRLLGKHLDGVSVKKVEEVRGEFKGNNDEFIYQVMRNGIFPFLNKNNIEVIVISGSLNEFLDLYKDEFGINIVHGIKFEEKDGKYLSNLKFNTGTTAGKEKIINSILADNKEILFAFGDSIVDIPLLKSARYTFVNNKKRFLEKDNIFYLDFNDEKVGAVILEKMSECLIKFGDTPER